MWLLSLLAFSAGAAITIQATMNAQLGLILKNSIIGTSIAFLIAFLFTTSILLISIKTLPHINDIKSVPLYLWFTGGALGAFGVGVLYYLIPKMGIGYMMSYSLSGQIIIAMLINHFGWFGLPEKPINLVKILGVVLLIIAVILINKESGYDY